MKIMINCSLDTEKLSGIHLTVFQRHFQWKCNVLSFTHDSTSCIKWFPSLQTVGKAMGHREPTLVGLSYNTEFMVRNTERN